MPSKGSKKMHIGVDEWWPVYHLEPSVRNDHSLSMSEDFIERVDKAFDEFEDVQRELRLLYNKQEPQWSFTGDPDA